MPIEPLSKEEFEECIRVRACNEKTWPKANALHERLAWLTAFLVFIFPLGFFRRPPAHTDISMLLSLVMFGCVYRFACFAYSIPIAIAAAVFFMLGAFSMTEIVTLGNLFDCLIVTGGTFGLLQCRAYLLDEKVPLYC